MSDKQHIIKSQTKSELLNDLYKDCNLVQEDYYTHQHFTILTRSGIEKVQYAKRIQVTFEVIHCEPSFVVVKATGTMGNETIETLGSASSVTSNNKYYPEMAEKRALSRVVLKLTKAYSFNVFGEDEADAFKNSNPNN